MATAGKGAKIQASTDGSSWADIDDVNGFSMNIDGENIDVTKMTASWIKRIQGLKDASWSFSGFYNPSDTNGQVRVRTALINDSAIYLKCLIDSTNGFSQQVRIDSFSVDSDVSGTNDLSVSASGTDAITVVS